MEPIDISKVIVDKGVVKFVEPEHVIPAKETIINRQALQNDQDEETARLEELEHQSVAVLAEIETLKTRTTARKVILDAVPEEKVEKPEPVEQPKEQPKPRTTEPL